MKCGSVKLVEENRERGERKWGAQCACLYFAIMFLVVNVAKG